jgi:hypothetical protein
MKHLLNDLSEQEKNAIREQHTGGMFVSTKKFSKLVNTKSGDAKPFLNEQEDVWSKYPCVKNMKDGLSDKGQKFKTDGKMQYYSNGRAMDPVSKKMYNYECGEGDEILTTLKEQEEGQSHQPSNFSSGQMVKAKRDKDGQVYTIKIAKADPKFMLGVVTGPGSYQGQSLRDGASLELYSYSPGKISGNSELGTFTVIK